MRSSFSHSLAGIANTLEESPTTKSLIAAASALKYSKLEDNQSSGTPREQRICIDELNSVKNKNQSKPNSKRNSVQESFLKPSTPTSQFVPSAIRENLTSRESQHQRKKTSLLTNVIGGEQFDSSPAGYCLRRKKPRYDSMNFCRRIPNNNKGDQLAKDKPKKLWFRKQTIPTRKLTGNVSSIFENSLNYLKKQEENLPKEKSLPENKDINKFEALNIQDVYELNKKEKESNAQPNSNAKKKDEPISETNSSAPQETINQNSTLKMNTEVDPLEDSHNSEEEHHKNKKRKKSFKVINTTTKKQISAKKLSLKHYFNLKELVLLPDNSFLMKWNVFVTLLLLFTAIVVPYRIAFLDDDDLKWIIVDVIVDLGFTVDMILNFFTAYYDEDDNLVVKKREIVLHYLKTWMLVDLCAILPFHYIFDSQKSYQSLGRIARLPRLYRLLKIAKVARIFRFVTHDVLTGMEKLITFIIILLIICHLIACGWFLIAKLHEFSPETWVARFGYLDESNLELYVTCFHFAFTLITTMGDSGIKAEGNSERVFYILSMFVGVCSYSFVLSCLTSFIQALDTKNAKFKEHLGKLEDLRMEYGIDYNTYIKMKKAIKYGISTNDAEEVQFRNLLPHSLRVELAVIMSQQMINKIPFFQNRPYHFISFVAPMLKKVQVHKEEFIYREGDCINEIYFLLSGKASLVLEEYNDMEYIKIEEGFYFGDTCIFCLGTNSSRIVSVKAIENCELIVLTKEDLFEIDTEYPEILSEMIKSAQKRLRSILTIKEKAIEFCETLPVFMSAKTNDSRRNSKIFNAKTAFYQNSEFQTSLKKIEEEEVSFSSSFTDESPSDFPQYSNETSIMKSKLAFKEKVLPKAKLKSVNVLQKLREKHLTPVPSHAGSLRLNSEQDSEMTITNRESQRSLPIPVGFSSPLITIEPETTQITVGSNRTLPEIPNYKKTAYDLIEELDNDNKGLNISNTSNNT